MKLAIVGSRVLKGNKTAQNIIESVIYHLKPTEIVSGGAEGIDTMAVEYAESIGIPTKVFPPKKKGWQYYKERDIKIAKYCDQLVRIYSSKATTHGSGWTKDYAEWLGKRTEEFLVVEE